MFALPGFTEKVLAAASCSGVAIGTEAHPPTRTTRTSAHTAVNFLNIETPPLDFLIVALIQPPAASATHGGGGLPGACKGTTSAGFLPFSRRRSRASRPRPTAPLPPATR